MFLKLFLLLFVAHQTSSSLLDPTGIVSDVITGVTNLTGTVINDTTEDIESTINSILDFIETGNSSSLDEILDTLKNNSIDQITDTIISETHIPKGTGLPISELIAVYGYEAERHEVTTEDGYILDVQRIPNGESNDVVLLVPGVLCAGDCWLVNGYESIAYILADLSYDVFILSPRGTINSLSHVNKNITKREYFNFTITEMSTGDLPATIDYVLELTNKSDLFYIGHSMGTTMSYILLSKLPEYNEKIRLVTSLAPVAYMGHFPNPLLRLLALFVDPIKVALEAAGDYDLFYLPNLLVTVLCNDLSPVQSVCQTILGVLAGLNPPRTNLTLLPLFLTHYAKGSGIYTVVHLAQFVNTNEFKEYDYGVINNLQRYGQEKPPLYNLSAITAPVALYYSTGDLLSSPIDVERLATELPNVVRNYLLPDALWSHLDYMYCIGVKDTLYDVVAEFMEEF